MNKIRNILVTITFALIANVGFAQMSLSEQSVFLDSVIKDMSDTSSAAVPILDQQLGIKDKVIRLLKDTIVQIEKDIKNHEIYYDRLNSQLDYEKKIYSDLIVKAHRLRSLMYENFDIFSFDNLYTTYRQFLYIKWLTDYRKKKIIRINSIKHDIEKAVVDFEKCKSNYATKGKQLGVEEEFLRKYASRRSSILRNLNNRAAVVDGEIHNNNLDSLRCSSRVSDSNVDSSTLFQLQEGYLMWPVHKAVIINYFGYKNHPVFENVKIKNDGLDFCVPSSSEVQCVYGGVVSKITLLPRNQYVIIVRHGHYYTVYNGLDKLKVSVGDVLERGDVVGGFDTNQTHANFNFQIWKDTECLDPYKWLIKYNKK